MKKIVLLFKGLCMGAVDTIPGVSSSTLAVIFGIYEQLTGTIGRFIPELKNRRATLTNIGFLLPIFLGAVIGILIFAGVISHLSASYPQATQLFFIGLIIGALPLIALHAGLNRPNIIKVAGLALGVVVMTVFIVASQRMGQQRLLLTEELPLISVQYGVKLFLVGFICAATMVVPGVSGSMLMVLLGEYYHIIGYINALRVSLLGGAAAVPLLQALVALSITAVGILLGIVVAARFINWALRHARSFTFSVIFAMMTLSTWLIWPGLGQGSNQLMLNMACLMGGSVLSFALSLAGHSFRKGPRTSVLR